HVYVLAVLPAAIEADQVDLRGRPFADVAVIHETRKRAREESHSENVGVTPLQRRSGLGTLLDPTAYVGETAQEVLELLLSPVLGEPRDPRVTAAMNAGRGSRIGTIDRLPLAFRLPVARGCAVARVPRPVRSHPSCQ